MAHVRSRRFAGPVYLANGYTTLYTVPADRVAVVRGLLVANTGGAAQYLLLAVNDGTQGDAPILFHQLPANESEVVLDYLVLNPGDVLKLAANANCTATLYGALLDGAPT